MTYLIILTIVVQEKYPFYYKVITHFEIFLLLAGKGLLHSSVRPVVVGYWSAAPSMPSPTTCLVRRKTDQSNLFTAQNEEELLREIIETFSTGNQWVLAVNLDNGELIHVKKDRKHVKGNCAIYANLTMPLLQELNPCGSINRGPNAANTYQICVCVCVCIYI